MEFINKRTIEEFKSSNGVATLYPGKTKAVCKTADGTSTNVPKVAFFVDKERTKAVAWCSLAVCQRIAEGKPLSALQVVDVITDDGVVINNTVCFAGQADAIEGFDSI